MWADGNQVTFMSMEMSHGYSNFSSLYKAGFEYRVSSSFRYSDRRRGACGSFVAGRYIDREAAFAMC